MDTGQNTAVLLDFLSKLGLQKLYPNKLTLQSLMEINKSSMCNEAVESAAAIPWSFLRKLFKINTECRRCTHLLNNDEEQDMPDLDFDFTDDISAQDININPLDLIVALFLCADSFLQQEMALKMSMCQFSIPLLLPHGNNSQCTLMLWALRDIVKEWCPHDLSESKGFVEHNIVQANIPLISFVRLKDSTLSKSQILNHVLSSGQQNHHVFIHRELEGGTFPRKIANGLVEVGWYLPCGRESLDTFPEPVAFGNLRGDISKSLAQFMFLFHVSTATFLFLDKIEESEAKILSSLEEVKSKLFLVVNRKEGSDKDMVFVKNIIKALDLENSHVKTKDTRSNTAEFSKKICAVIRTLLTNVETSINIVNMSEKAVELGLSVDECKSELQKQAAGEIMKGIGVQTIPDYKKQHLPLQGDNWKRLSQLEKEECRLKKCAGKGLEQYKSELQAEQTHIKEMQCKYKLSKAMGSFIRHMSTSDKEKRHFFLKWMKLKLNAFSRDKLSKLRNKFKEHCKEKNAKLIAELDQALLDSSLGIEHYLREMGLIYEVSLQSQQTLPDMSHLPGLAAEMLLDGCPLELLDGDASNIPVIWVTDVLMELHKRVGGKSKLLVLTVLGVQSTGKSTLLNTMFGVQFPVSSGRCTRGAFMLFLGVGEDLKSELNFDFILLIDTEGLKSPDLAQLDDSYEHDNQLATLVIGLSDITLINIAMENATEMKDVLQIAAHAFLRMKQIGKKPVCHFVHQNVAGVSAHTKNMAERKHLLDQLNEMTQVAAEMEKQHSVNAFTDVLDYDMEKNNWNIPGLWHGTPPMAPINTGYSEAVADLKKGLLETVKCDKHHELSDIPEFLEWMKSLWKSVKYENFIFSFRNTLVAHAYDNLCKEFLDWEWDFKKTILAWETATELEITNADDELEIQALNMLLASKNSEVADIIATQEIQMKEKLRNYYKRKDRHVNLIEKYKMDFFNSITGFANEIKQSMRNKVDYALEQKINLKKALEIQKEYRGTIEERVMKLLSDCKHSTLSDEQLTQEFERMWAANTVNVSCLKARDISAYILEELRKNFLNQNVNEDLQNIEDLNEMGKGPFQTKRDHLDSYKNHFRELFTRGLQNFADNIIKTCTSFVCDKAKTKGDYHDSFTRDLLKKIDDSVTESRKCHKTSRQFEIDLKLHICGIASREFCKMHKKFLAAHNPKTQLEKYKDQYLSDFLDLYKQSDHCQRKATDFAQCCIKPAIEEYIDRSLGIDIVDEILTSCHSLEYSSRSFFQYSILKELLEKENFQSYVKYIDQYEIFVKDWIFQHILQKMYENNSLSKLRNKNLQTIFSKIMNAIDQGSKRADNTLLPNTNESIQELITNMRKCLIKDITLSEEAEKRTLFQIRSTCHPFTECLIKSMNELKEQLEGKFSNSEDISETLEKLPIKPQNELFSRVFGCGQQCPFCKIPCEAGGKEHTQHHAAVHRPQGLGFGRNEDNDRLIEVLCTSDVYSDMAFCTEKTNDEFHPYRDYRVYYPDWSIPADPSIEASDYWKYVLVKYNKKFAKEYEAKPADVPEEWKKITKAQALKGLKDAFSMN
ncbi:up-regulator of cell proliferation-like [Thalassophryne amazonica]|uniref:up-regulator of cell proliferation-like n=1 Tax=Thalassophryne amazonica TaxID=390379 RepID=UPI0014713EF2|nr:up-regulator of cell proliferation-like [Thalassophryne amazonica]